MVLDWLQSIFLGIIQGISEFLPISSSGHLILFSYFTQGKPISLSLNVALHTGTLIAILVYYQKIWFNLFISFFSEFKQKGRDFKFHTHPLFGLFIATIPAAISGVFFSDLIEFYFHKPLPIVINLCLFGFLLHATDVKRESKLNWRELKIHHFIILGLGQALALFPGVSRSGITITTARALGIKKEEACHYSFLMGAPVLFGAFILHINDFKNVYSDPDFYLGMTASMITGFLAIRFFMKFIQSYSFKFFMFYRIGIAGIILSWIIIH
jgi:undecaprenyl-diphosphatase